MATPNETPRKTRPWLRPLILVLVIAAIIVLARVFHLEKHVDAVRAWITGLGFWAPVVFVLIYIAAVVAALPGGLITIAAGALFGPVEGVICASIGSTVGASLAFLIGRYFARDSIERWLSKSDRFSRIERLTEEQGAIVVALTRLVPLFPFNVLNYALGLTRVRFWTYVFWSWLCMLPGTILYVILASATAKGVSQGKVPWAQIIVIAADIAILAVLIAVARRRLRGKKPNAAPQPAPEEPHHE